VRGDAVAARARALVGTRFRAQGRRPEHGLDCIGLVAAAGDLPADMMPSGYTLRSEVPDSALGLRFGGRVTRIETQQAGVGDVLLVRAGALQNHFLVLVDGGFVHADASLGRVVERPGAVPWPALAAWRMTGEG
jgi:cell wall-associated NlpC family hydrolase